MKNVELDIEPIATIKYQAGGRNIVTVSRQSNIWHRRALDEVPTALEDGDVMCSRRKRLEGGISVIYEGWISFESVPVKQTMKARAWGEAERLGRQGRIHFG